MKVTLSRTYEISEIPSQILDILQKTKKTAGCLDPIWFEYVSTLVQKGDDTTMPLRLAKEEMEKAKTQLDEVKGVLTDCHGILSSYIEFLENQEKTEEAEQQAVQEAIEQTQRTIQNATDAMTTTTPEAE